MSFKKSFFKNISFFAFYSYIIQGIEFLSTIILSRILLPEEYGIVAIIYLFTGFIQLFANAGIGQSLVRSEYGATFHRYLFNLSVWLGLILTVLLCALSYPIALFFDDLNLIWPLLLASLFFTFDSFNYIPNALLSKELKFNTLGKVKLISGGVTIILQIILALLGFSYWALIIPMTISPLLQYYMQTRYIKFPFRMYSLKAAFFALSKIKTLMANLTLQNSISYWGKNLDKMIVGKAYSTADLGLYNRALRFVDMNFRLITGIFSQVLFPSLKKLQASNGDINKEYTDILGIITLLNFPLSAILIAIPEGLVRLLWGENWIEVAFYLPYIGVFIIFQSIISTMRSMFMLYNKEKSNSLIVIISAIVNVVAISIGAMYSIHTMMIMYTLVNVFVIVPVNIYLGFYRAFNFKVTLLLKFWLPKIILSAAMLFGIINHAPVIVNISLFLFFIHLLVNQRNAIYSFINFVKTKLLSKRPK